MNQSKLDFLLVDYDHVRKYMLLHDIDEARVEDDQLNIELDHVPQRNTLDNDHSQVNRERCMLLNRTSDTSFDLDNTYVD
jgi:hypothetical protein